MTNVAGLRNSFAQIIPKLMSELTKPKILITGATGQVGSKVIAFITNSEQADTVEIVAAVRTTEKANYFSDRGISSVIFDFDDESTHAAALQGIDRVLIVTGYTVDMLRQSKALLDAAKAAGVQHVVHLGACGRDDTTVAHWAWHQLVERYIEWSGFSFTHLRPETFMQNMLSYGGKPAITNGVLHQYVQGARKSWVDVDDVAQVAALALLHPEKHAGQVYRLGYDAKSYYEIAELLTRLVGQPFEYQPQAPEVFLQNMKDAGAEMAYMSCVYDHYKRYAAGTIPGADDTFDNFPAITGQEPIRWADFIEKHKSEFVY
jgi:NAD(P)H dehydrogenase (quinone)